MISPANSTVRLGLALLLGCAALATLHADAPPADLSIENKALLLKFHPADGTMTVQDKRTNKTWNQKAASVELSAITPAVSTGNAQQIEFQTTERSLKAPMKGTIALTGDLPEFIVTLSGDGEQNNNVAYPEPFVGGDNLIIPMNEGIRYPVSDTTLHERDLITYGGHGISMPFWGVTDGDGGYMAIFETSNDASIQIKHIDKGMCVEPKWHPQMGKFGYDRHIRYIFFDQGGYVAMCKRYRAYAQSIGLFKTLAQKRQENPNIDKLIGAANVWYFNNSDPVPMAQEMIAAGIPRMLWSSAHSPNVDALNKLGLLTGCYDLYQDIMNPAMYPKLEFNHGDWIPQAWPTQIVLDAKGEQVKGWEVKTKDGVMYPCNVLSDRFAPDYARERIKKDLEKNPYGARFIDTTTASGLREDYSPDHPQTRTECRKYRMELLNVVSQEYHLVTGSETGFDIAVPYVAYFEGMLSLGPYRLPDAGRDMQKIWTDPAPEDLTKFQTGAYYRLPLWELVYHDCVVAHWYWGDYNNKIPALWDKRDLFNMLYGTAPMFMFDRKFWDENKARFVQSYENTCPVARSVGYSEMTDFKWLTPDALVQQSHFANGVTVTVNFGTDPYASADGQKIAPGGFLVAGLKEAAPTP